MNFRHGTYPGQRTRRTMTRVPYISPSSTNADVVDVASSGAAAAAAITTANNDASQFAQQSAYLIPAEIRLISGCHSEQTSADVANIANCCGGNLPDPAGRSGGACTSALLSILYEHHQQQKVQTPPLSFQQLLLELRKRLAQSGLSQIPQLSSSRPLELNETPFSLVGSKAGVCRAVLVGINYRGQNGELSGCWNDIWNMKKYLVECQGYSEDHILILMDDGKHHYPTREKIIRALQQLVIQSAPGDSVYFHYSGHGGLLDPDWGNLFKQNGGTEKEYDETLYPVDHGRAGQIRDFSLFHHFVQPMAAGVTVTCVMDCCHSGSVLDLPYRFQPTPAGTIRMQRSVNALSNLAFLYILAGGMLPMGGLFDGIANSIEHVTGNTLDSFQGVGLEEMTNDTTTFGMDTSDYVDYTNGNIIDSVDDRVGDDYAPRDADFDADYDAAADAANGDASNVIVDGRDVDYHQEGLPDPPAFEPPGGGPLLGEGGPPPPPLVDGGPLGEGGFPDAGFDDGGFQGFGYRDGDFNDGGYRNVDFGGDGGFDNGGFGAAGGFGDDGVGGMDGDVDCGCLSDVLGALLDDEQ